MKTIVKVICALALAFAAPMIPSMPAYAMRFGAQTVHHGAYSAAACSSLNTFSNAMTNDANALVSYYRTFPTVGIARIAAAFGQYRIAATDLLANGAAFQGVLNANGGGITILTAARKPSASGSPGTNIEGTVLSLDEAFDAAWVNSTPGNLDNAFANVGPSLSSSTSFFVAAATSARNALTSVCGS